MNTKKEEEKKDEMTKKERDMMSKMSKTEVIKQKYEITNAITQSRIMKCNLKRLAYLYDETNKKIEKIEKNGKKYNNEYHQCSICDCIKMLISLLFAIGLIAVEFTWIYNSPKESKYVVKINLNENLNNNSYNNNNILFRYLDDLNDK